MLTEQTAQTSATDLADDAPAEATAPAKQYENVMLDPRHACTALVFFALSAAAAILGVGGHYLHVRPAETGFLLIALTSVIVAAIYLVLGFNKAPGLVPVQPIRFTEEEAAELAALDSEPSTAEACVSLGVLLDGRPVFGSFSPEDVRPRPYPRRPAGKTVPSLLGASPVHAPKPEPDPMVYPVLAEPRPTPKAVRRIWLRNAFPVGGPEDLRA